MASEETLTLELTVPERDQLLQLLDLAVKAGGLNAASAAVPLALKLQSAEP